MNDKASENGNPKDDQDGSMVNKEPHGLPPGNDAKPSPAEAVQLLKQASQAADRVVTLQRFPKYWLALYASLIPAVYSLPLMVGNKWVYVWSVAVGMLAAYVILVLTWPKLIRTGLGQDERLRLQSALMFIPLMLPSVFINIFYDLRVNPPWLQMAVVFVVMAFLLVVFAWGVLHWFNVRVLARAFDFTESEEIWDSARAEIRRRIERVEAEEKARRRARREERWQGQARRARRQGNVPGGSLENE